MQIKLPFYLASSSPRRQQFLRDLGISFVVIKPDVSEDVHAEEIPEEFVQRIAREKAYNVLPEAKRMSQDEGLILAADTVVTLDRTMLGKPAHPAEARSMLHRLSNTTHVVMTSFCLIRWTHTVTCPCISRRVNTSVTFRALSADEIETYIASGDPMDKAGAYGIQQGAAHMVARIHGSYTNVVGLPLAEVYETLQHLFKGA